MVGFNDERDFIVVVYSRLGRIYLFYLMLADVFEMQWILCLIMVIVRN